MSASTHTFILINGQVQNSLYFGVLKAEDEITMEVTCPAGLEAIMSVADGLSTLSFSRGTANPLLGLSDAYTVFQMHFTASVLFKGITIPLRLVERLGNGKLRLISLGFSKEGFDWKFVKSEQEIQFYHFGEGKLFTPFLINQKELLAKLMIIADYDSWVPSYTTDYKEFVPEVGTVKWFDAFKGIGAIAGPDGDIFFHLNDIKVRRGRKPLLLSDICREDDFYRVIPKPGQKVRFDSIPSTGHFPYKALWVAW